MKVVMFTNFSNKKFAHPNHPKNPGNDEHCQWGKVPYSFAPGQSIYLEVGVANVLAKHLITREGFAKGLDSIRGQMKEGNDPIGKSRLSKTFVNEMMAKCLGEEIIDVANEMDLFELNSALSQVAEESVEDEVEEEVVEEPNKEAPKKKVKKKEVKKVVEEPKEKEFEGLNE